jgi:hypothetical protein
MSQRIENPTDLVRFDDRLVYDASYKLSARAIKTVCFIASHYIDPKTAKDLPRPIFVPLNELAKALSDGRQGKKSNSLYANISSLCEELVNAKIRFKTDVKVEGKDLDGFISWCSDAVPTEKNGVKGISFGFGIYMSQFLIGLSRYVAVYRPELNRLNKSYSIRLFQILKGLYNKRKKYRSVFKKVFSVSELRYLLDLGDKYSSFKIFNDKVLKPALKEINKNTSIYIVSMDTIRRSGRKISHIEFTFTENKQSTGGEVNFDFSKFQDYVPSKEDIDTLTFAEFRAYQMLVEFQVKPGIVFKQILPDINGTETQGFEDYFIAAALDFFRSSANNQQTNKIAAGTFVNWWIKLRLFDTTSEVWSKIIERVVEEKKTLKKKDPTAYDNRLTAKEMTHVEFREWWNNQTGEEEDKITIIMEEQEGYEGFDSVAEVIQKYQLSDVDFTE